MTAAERDAKRQEQFAKLRRNFNEARNKNVGTYVVSGNATNNKLYDKAETGKEQILASVAKDLFLNSQLVVDVAGDLFEPIGVVGTTVLTANVGSSTDIVVTSWETKDDSVS